MRLALLLVVPLLALGCGGGAGGAKPTTAPTATATPVATVTATAAPRNVVAKDLPLVAIVRADWCPACRSVEPKLAVIEKEYAGKIAFLHLDVTDDDTAASASQDADAAGVGTFFGQAKGRTATIGVFSKDRKELFRTWGLKSEAEFRAALDDAAK